MVGWNSQNFEKKLSASARLSSRIISVKSCVRYPRWKGSKLMLNCMNEIRFQKMTTHLTDRCVFWILERSKSKNRHPCHRIRRGMVLDSFYLPDLATKFSERKKLLNTSIAWAKSEGLDRIGTSSYIYWMHQEIVWPFKGEIGWFRRQFAISFHFTFILNFWRFAKHVCSISE